MRVITVQQPWAWAIIHGGKNVENRVRNLAGQYRGPLAIHAGLTGASFDGDHGDLWPFDERHVTGAIIGVVNLRATHHAEFCTEADEHGEVCSKWAEPDVWHLELDDPRALAEPIPFRGALGMRTLPPEVITEVYRELNAPHTVEGTAHD
ncbi:MULTISPECIES: ASCH domain-containing protein [unclassified Cryobacterium]|uniref:ASCH domain-containing protein n=1 Tax=unclassified Cryobacterium TaxID=2649013 RepID=UPI0010698768|nr:MULTISPECIES: ASCH domain-containing protein [unclassified Cryobacterium]TFC59431.1 ASCH domain-containing protein [Cryobacterium sp. TMB3-1-2]TFC67227.1 ASCH domain-containing protein [Cryobacterium sp. TMB3-15]TFC73260.1 ASCH domain-containing protein [Cryobacterium sp. TMB3-10]TFD46148.1 ASCH domain-containing protein [Cryobacterium sp. TMB3-12]